MEESDSPIVADWRHSPEVRRWLYAWDPPSLESQRRWFHGARERGDILFMLETLGGEPVATASLYWLDRRLGRTAEWGRFVAAPGSHLPRALTEGAYLVHRIWFEVLGMRRLIAHLLAGNLRSHRMARFLGYVDEGIRREHWQHPDGHCEDVLELGLLAEEFAARRPRIEKTLYPREPPPRIEAEQAASICARLEPQLRKWFGTGI